MTKATRTLRCALSSPLTSLLLVVAIGAGLYLPFLGYAGFTQSEGFRVFPAWHMLHSGDWLVTRLFEQPYLRKPPGMPWAVAAMSLIFGENEWAARSVSGFSMILGGVVCWWAARRWYTRRCYAPLAGLAYIVAPMFWADPGPGRAAEIEALHNVCVLTVIVLTFEGQRVMQRGAGSARRALLFWHYFTLGLALAAEFLVKGPSGFPAVAAVVVACGWRSRRLIIPMLASLGMAGAIVLWWYLSLKAAVARLDPPPVQEPTSQFLWTPGKELKVLLLPLTAFGAGMPFTLTALYTLVFGDRGRKPPGYVLAQALFLGIAFYTVLGVSNQRYVMPALVLGPLAFPGSLDTLRGHWPGEERRRTIGRLLQLHRPGLIIAILAVAGALYSVRLEHRKSVRTSGKDAGIALGDRLAADVTAHTPPGQVPAAEVWGDEYIDTRPEVLWYARREAATKGVALRVRWTPGLDKTLALPPKGGYLILRVDDGEREFREPEWPSFAVMFAGVKPVAEGTAHIFTFRVYRIDGKVR